MGQPWVTRVDRASIQVGPKKWSEISPNGSTQKTRVLDLRAALDAAAGGVEPASEDVTSALMRALSGNEKDALFVRLASKQQESTESRTLAMWAAIGQSFVKVLSNQAKNLALFMALMCIVLRGANIGSRKRIKTTLGIGISVSAWRRTKDKRNVDCVEKRSNGRLGYRKLKSAAVLEILGENAVETSQFLKGNKRAREKSEGLDAAEKQVKVAKQLTDSKSQIYLGNDNVCVTIGKSTWCRYLAKDFPEYRRAKRKLDMCKKCMQWDYRVAPSAKASIGEWRRTLQDLLPTYWDVWDKDVAPTFGSEASSNLSAGCIEAFTRYIEGHAASRPASKAKGAVKLALELHRVEAKIANELHNKWSKIAGQADVGLLPLVQMHGLHFALRDAQKAQSKKDLNTPSDGHLYFWMDFKEHVTLPVGPEEDGDWWYPVVIVCLVFLVDVVNFKQGKLALRII